MGCDSESADWSQAETDKVMCIQAFSGAVSQLSFGGVDEKYFTSVFLRSSLRVWVLSLKVWLEWGSHILCKSHAW